MIRWISRTHWILTRWLSGLSGSHPESVDTGLRDNEEELYPPLGKFKLAFVGLTDGTCLLRSLGMTTNSVRVSNKQHVLVGGFNAPAKSTIKLTITFLWGSRAWDILEKSLKCFKSAKEHFFLARSIEMCVKQMGVHPFDKLGYSLSLKETFRIDSSILSDIWMHISQTVQLW